MFLNLKRFFFLASKKKFIIMLPIFLVSLLLRDIKLLITRHDKQIIASEIYNNRSFRLRALTIRCTVVTYGICINGTSINKRKFKVDESEFC